MRRKPKSRRFLLIELGLRLRNSPNVWLRIHNPPELDFITPRKRLEPEILEDARTTSLNLSANGILLWGPEILPFNISSSCVCSAVSWVSIKKWDENYDRHKFRIRTSRWFFAISSFKKWAKLAFLNFRFHQINFVWKHDHFDHRMPFSKRNSLRNDRINVIQSKCYFESPETLHGNQPSLVLQNHSFRNTCVSMRMDFLIIPNCMIWIDYLVPVFLNDLFI